MEGAQNRTNIWFAFCEECKMDVGLGRGQQHGRGTEFIIASFGICVCVCSRVCWQCCSSQSLPSSRTVECQKP